jgi:hypothetical protein
MSTALLKVLSMVNTLLWEVAVKHPQYHDRCIEVMKLLRKEVDKENESIIKNYNLIKKQLGNERNN